MSGPTFIGIGAQKAATSWLYVQLASHPRIRLDPAASSTADKERHFWCRDIHRGTSVGESFTAGDIDDYLRSFPDGVSGEITPHYAVLDRTAVELVHRHVPSARVIYLLRNPIERAWSAATARLAPDFDASSGRMIRWEREGRELEGDERRLRQMLRSDEVRANSDAVATLTRWTRVFGDEAVLVLRYEQVSEDPRALLRAAYRHIGVDESHAGAIEAESLAARIDPHRPAPLIPFRFNNLFTRYYEQLIVDIEEYLGEDLSAWRLRRSGDR